MKSTMFYVTDRAGRSGAEPFADDRSIGVNAAVNDRA